MFSFIWKGSPASGAGDPSFFGAMDMMSSRRQAVDSRQFRAGKYNSGDTLEVGVTFEEEKLSAVGMNERIIDLHSIH